MHAGGCRAHEGDAGGAQAFGIGRGCKAVPVSSSWASEEGLAQEGRHGVCRGASRCRGPLRGQQ